MGFFRVKSCESVVSASPKSSPRERTLKDLEPTVGEGRVRLKEDCHAIARHDGGATYKLNITFANKNRPGMV